MINSKRDSRQAANKLCYECGDKLCAVMWRLVPVSFFSVFSDTEKGTTMTEIHITEEKKNSTAVLVGVETPEMRDGECDASLDELERLAETAGAVVAARLVQSREKPDVRTVIGSGKVAELKTICSECGAELCIFDCEMSPSQIRNVEDEVGEVRVIDRSMLILDIFALHAATAEGKLQVELAQLKYTAPRLIGKGKQLSRLGGGIGTRGPGESKLESDKRHLARRVASLEAELEAVENTRRTTRSARDRSGLPHVAIVGYTNAGKSTLLNRLTDAGILAEDKLFATLDPTTRKFTLPGGESVLLTDTVGFIRKLPHHLVKAFRSTLEEAALSDILLHIVDASDPEYPDEMKVTEELLAELGAGGKPMLIVYNKCDREADGIHAPALTPNGSNRAVCVSALTGQGVDEMVAMLEAIVREGKVRVTFRFPNSEAGALSSLYRMAAVESVEYGDEYITAVAVADAKTRGVLAAYELK